jgi:hypothetical protein
MERLTNLFCTNHAFVYYLQSQSAYTHKSDQSHQCTLRPTCHRRWSIHESQLLEQKPGILPSCLPTRCRARTQKEPRLETEERCSWDVYISHRHPVDTKLAIRQHTNSELTSQSSSYSLDSSSTSIVCFGMRTSRLVESLSGNEFWGLELIALVDVASEAGVLRAQLS